MYHPKNYNERKIQLALTNLAIGNHDLICDCSEQGYHTLRILAKQLGPELTKQQKKKLKNALVQKKIPMETNLEKKKK